MKWVFLTGIFTVFLLHRLNHFRACAEHVRPVCNCFRLMNGKVELLELQLKCLFSRMEVKMLITLCYVYMWVRFHKCYSVLIRNSLSRLNSKSFSFSFVSSSSPSAGAIAPTNERHACLDFNPLQNEDIIFLQLGDKSVYVTEPQVGDWVLRLLVKI